MDFRPTHARVKFPEEFRGRLIRRTCRAEHLAAARWDAIVVGTGIGGATLGHELARNGARVLFLEKGPSLPHNSSIALRGDYAEHHFSSQQNKPDQNLGVLRRAGRYAQALTESSKASEHAFIPLLGEGVGGSSALFGMVMERLFPSDFESQLERPDGTSAGPNWPISYEQLRPFYRAAEKLYRVRGGRDPLRAGAVDPLPAQSELSGPSREVFDFLAQKGKHPYVMPLAFDDVPDCQECLGYLCAKKCKNDSARVCLTPALDRFGAELLAHCEVLSLTATQKRVTGVQCWYEDRLLVFNADRVFLAAGALHSPALLLRSRNAYWNKGLANSSGQVGRNLMRHLFDLYCVHTTAAIGPNTRTKQIACNDLYAHNGHKLGTLQAVGRLPNPGRLVDDLSQELARKGVPLMPSVLQALRPIAARWAKRKISSRLILTAIMEDLPSESNCVSVTDDGRLSIQYRIQKSDQQRLRIFRREVRRMLRPKDFTFIPNASNNERLAHACGTCRFGLDPRQSVVDQDNRTHDLENLYIVDASFFPTSTGINPALTIAANALRVARRVRAAG